MSDFNLLINGKMVPGDLTIPVLNPATEEVLAQCPRASKGQLDAAVAVDLQIDEAGGDEGKARRFGGGSELGDATLLDGDLDWAARVVAAGGKRRHGKTPGR